VVVLFLKRIFFKLSIETHHNNIMQQRWSWWLAVGVLVICVAVVYVPLVSNAQTSGRPVVNTSYGPVMGLESTSYNVYTFLGIPFAVPPGSSFGFLV